MLFGLKLNVFNRRRSILEQHFQIICNNTLYDETWIAITKDEYDNFIKIRHKLQKTTELVRHLGHTKLSIDMAVPFERLKEYFLEVEKKFNDFKIPSCIYGHISSSHLHCDMFYKNIEEKINAENIYSEIIDFGLRIGGTISAEHGIGKIKKEFFYRMYSSDQINKMKAIKNIFDKKNILNISNIFYY